ncbi:MAG: molybdopterin-dependent oxidoreductase [Anaerolineales bacterium]|jgi:thiosulfate reductase/polysulfide reductase chain A|nr:molybdopterin-dependent oxidoreductase [Anaerolineales bacterium]
MTNTISRRDFLKLGAATGAVLAAGQMLSPLAAQAARESGQIDQQGDGYISSMCEMCVWRCGLIAKIKGGRVVKLDGNPQHPHSRGNLCPRGQSGLMNTYDPDRVLTPLIRVGKRGEGLFRKASWDEALDLVASKMLEIKQKYGPEAMVFSSTHNLSQPLFENLLYGFGSPNYGTQRSLCFNAMIVANLMTYGMEEPGRDYKNVKYIILTGRNLMEAISTSETHDLSHAIDAGVKVVYLDPRYTKTASKAGEWLPIRPGTDLAFHLALLNIIIGEKLYDQSFVSRYTVGFDELAKEVQRYTPDWAAQITGIPAETITRIAHEFAAAGKYALAHNGWRTSNFVNSFGTQRAITALNTIIGNWGVTLFPALEEGAGLGSPPQPPYPRISALRLDGVPWKFPFVPLKLGIFQELRNGIYNADPYQAHGWFISRQNPVLSIPDRNKTLETFGKMDFIVTVDIIMNDTAWFSDVILPEASYLERYDPLLPVGDKAFIRQPVIEPQGEAKSALWIYKQLGERLGLADYFQYADEEDYLRQQLAPLGVSLEEVREKGYAEMPGEGKLEYSWNTTSGKVELFSETLANAGFDGMAKWEEPPMPAADQFYLLTGKVAQHTQFGTHNNQLLHKYSDEPRLSMNAKVAAQKGLKSGDWVAVTSEVGKIHILLEATEAIRPDCVFMAPGFGHISKGLTTAFGFGASDSVLHVTYTDPVSGGQALSQTFVSVEKIAGAPNEPVRKPLHLGE